MTRIVPASPSSTRGAPPADLGTARRLNELFKAAGLRPATLLRAPDLDPAGGGTRVWLVLESLQITGSFKVRGALMAVRARARAGATRVVAASAGNHGAGIAFAARYLGVAATVVVPASAPKAKRDKIAALGAELVTVPGAYDDAEAAARELAAAAGQDAFVSPYDDLDVVLGNGASLGFEIATALDRAPTTIVAPFGGGGLATGLAWALPHSSVWGAQSEASPAMALSLERGVAVERLDPVAGQAPTLAEGLEGGISAAAFERARDVVSGVIVAPEASIADAMRFARRDLGLVLEGSAAVALVPVLDGLPEALRGGDLAVVLTGRNVDAPPP